MRAAVYYGREDLRLEQVPEPQPGPDEVKLRILFNGICGSDLHEYYDGPIATRTEPHPLTGVRNPVILGHEMCGEVVQVGEGVEDLERGMRVAVEPVETCGNCLYCRCGQYNHCGCSRFTVTTATAAGSRSSRSRKRKVARSCPTRSAGSMRRPCSARASRS